MKSKAVTCGFCAKPLPEPFHADNIVYAKGRFYEGPACISCIKKYNLTITSIEGGDRWATALRNGQRIV